MAACLIINYSACPAVLLFVYFVLFVMFISPLFLSLFVRYFSLLSHFALFLHMHMYCVLQLVLSPSCCFLLLLLLLFSCYILLSPLLLSGLFCFLFSPSPMLFNNSSSVLRFWKRIRKVILKPRLPASLRTAKGTYLTLINTPP